MQKKEQKAVQEVIKICQPEVDAGAVVDAIEKAADAVVEVVRKLADAVAEVIPAIIKTVNETWERVKEHIQTMPEDQYKEFLEELTPEARGWAAAIRAGSRPGRQKGDIEQWKRM